MMAKISIKKLEADLWESADLLRADSKLTSNQYCMPVLALLFLRYAYSRYKVAEAEIQSNRPSRNGKMMPLEASDFKAKSALFLPKEAQYDYLVNLPDNIQEAHLKTKEGNSINSFGEAINNAMLLIEEQDEQLAGILPKDYTTLSDSLLRELVRIFNNKTIDEVGGDVIGRIYEYFLSKFAKAIASDDGVFFTPKSLVKMLVNVLEPKQGIMLDPACGSGGMFVQTGDFVNQSGMIANQQMTFYGQEKVEYNAKLCLMNMAVHRLSGKIISGNDANTFSHDAHNLAGKCDYVMANPPFNVNKVKLESTQAAGRLPFGLPSVNDKTKEIGNANYLWISYFYAYLNERGRAGFVMASSATDSSNKEKDIREKLVRTGHVDVMVSVGNNFFYTLSLPCSLWFFDKGKSEELRDKVLFIDARNYFTEEERTLNKWTEWQLKNLNAIVWLYRGEKEKYTALLSEYRQQIGTYQEETNEESIKQSLDTDLPFETICSMLKKNAELLKERTKKAIEAVNANADLKPKEKKKQTKALQADGDALEDWLDEVIMMVCEADWLYSKFGEGEYQDVLGLCKIATVEEIAEKNYSLTPGAYVGVAEMEDDGVDFHERMTEIHSELLLLNEKANDLMKEISENFKGLEI
jgi:type I restriction enzyme M protein